MITLRIHSLSTAKHIVDDLCYSGNFTTSKNPNLDAIQIPYVDRPYDYKDELHIDRAYQYVFNDQKTVDQLQSSHAHILEPAKKSMEAHGKLEECVKAKRLFYALFQTNEHNAHDKDSPKKDAYIFAVGVSPYGNLVGVMTIQLATHLRGNRSYIYGDGAVEYDDDDEEGEGDDDDDDDEPDAGSIFLINRPDPLPDDSPRHIFYHKENESALSHKLMLYDDYKVVVSFEGMLPPAASDESQVDVVFLR